MKNTFNILLKLLKVQSSHKKVHWMLNEACFQNLFVQHAVWAVCVWGLFLRTHIKKRIVTEKEKNSGMVINYCSFSNKIMISYISKST